ncbi:MAG: ATP-binding protein [candidate division WOR-3 bacterium]
MREVSNRLVLPPTRIRPWVGLLIVGTATGVLVAGLVAGIGLYRAGLGATQERLRDTAQGYARLVEALVAHEQRFAPHLGPEHGDPLTASLGILQDALAHFPGRSSDLVLGWRDGDSIRLLLWRRALVPETPKALGAGEPSRGVPIRRALAGESGTMIGPDYRGTTVVAGYEPIAGTDFGIVAKVDLAEVQAPFVRAGIVAGAIALFIALAVALTWFGFTGPLIDHLTEQTAALQSARDAVIITDLGFRIRSWNKAAEELYGWKQSEAKGQVLPELLQTELPGLTHAQAQRQLMEYGFWQGDGAQRHRDGSRILVWSQRSVVRGPRGQPQAIVIINRDQRERKLAEEERSRLVEALQQKTEEFERMLHMTTHDLRSPLVSIEGFAREIEIAVSEVLGDLTRSGLEARLGRSSELLRREVPAALGYVRSSVEKMRGLLDALTKLGRLGRASVNIETLDTNALVERVLASLQHQVKEVGAEVEVGALPRCRGDALFVDQVFANLIENALKFREPSRALRISITGQEKGNRAVFCVEDNGQGMTPEVKARATGLFYQLDGRRGGQGLGLASVVRLLERMHGRLEIESEPGKGSRFLVELPSVRAAKYDTGE